MRIRNQSLSFAAGLVLSAVFAVCMVSVLLSGAGIYKHLAQEDQLLWERRTCSQFIAAKVRSASSPELIDVVDIEGTQALIIEEQGELAGCRTLIYTWDGMLMELFTAGGSELSEGEPIACASELSFQLQKSLLTASYLDSSGHAQLVKLDLRGGQYETK